MSEKIELQSETVQETMLIPLWGRATYSRLYPELLTDPYAQDIIERLDYDFSSIASTFGEYGGIAYLVRSRRFEDSIKVFIKKHPQATIVNLGSGLDTTFFRVDNGQIHWYDIDLPDAITFRKNLISETDRSTCLSYSVFDRGWLDEIDYHPEKGIFIIAGGLFMYFDEIEVCKLFIAMAERFPGGEIHFDTMPKLGRVLVNARLKKMGVPMMHFTLGVRNPQKELAKWSPKLYVMESCTFFSNINLNPKWNKGTKIMMKTNNWLATGGFVHLRFQI